VLLRFATVEFFFLVSEESLERLLELASDDGNERYQINGFVDQLLAEGDNYNDFLEMHLNHSLADESRTEKGPEWHQEVAACNTSEIKQWIRDLEKDKP
jgi:hypothetical protein